MSGGYLVPDAIAEEIARQTDAIVWDLLRDRRTWEQRLADAIDERSVRNRVRRRTRTLRDIPRRLSNARAALAGEWEADE